MDGTCRALRHTLLAKLTLSVVDVSHIVLHCDSLERTYLGTLAAADTCCLAGLACNSTLVLVDARYEYTHVPATLVADLDDILRTCLHTCSAGCTLLLVHNGKSGGWVHGDGAELAGCHAVSATETTERTSCVTAVKGSLHTA